MNCRKFDAVVVDLQLGEQAGVILDEVRSSRSNRTAVTFAISGSDAADEEGIKSKVRISAAGNRSGGTSYSRGALYQILKNRIYLGEIHHRGQNYPGEQLAIIPRELWERVQAQLRSDNQGRRNGLKANLSSLLVGLLQDAEGNRFIPSHTLKNGKRYRYYVCQVTIDGRGQLSDRPDCRPMMLNGRSRSGCGLSCSPPRQSWMSSAGQKTLRHGLSSS